MTPRESGDKEIHIGNENDGWNRAAIEVDCDDCDLDSAIANAQLIARIASPEVALEIYALLSTWLVPDESGNYPRDTAFYIPTLHPRAKALIATLDATAPTEDGK